MVPPTHSLVPYLPANPPRLYGQNAHAFVDSDDLVPGLNFNVFAPPSGQETTPSSGTDFIYPFGDHVTADYDCGAAFRCSWDPKTPFDWIADGDQAATQLFYFVNRFHDHLETAPGIEFTEDNFEGSGRVVAQAQDGAAIDDGDTPGFPGAQHANNTNMLTLPAGTAPGALMQMHLLDPPRDPDLDEEPNYRPVHGGDDPSLSSRVHARAQQPAGDRRAGLRRAQRGAGRGDRRGHRGLVRARLPGGRRHQSLLAG